MPEKDTQKQSVNSSVAVEKSSSGFSVKPGLKIGQEKAYQILSSGIILTMEDDLKAAMKEQKMKADLIPGQAREKEKSETFIPEKSYFDPFKALEQMSQAASVPSKPDEQAAAEISVGQAEQKEKPLALSKADIAAGPKPEEIVPRVGAETEAVKKALAEKTKLDEERKEREETELIRQKARIQAQKEAPVLTKAAPLAAPAKSALVSSPHLERSDWLKNIAKENLPKIKQELGQKTLHILNSLKRISLEEKPFLEKRARVLQRLKERGAALDKARKQAELVKEKQKQIEVLEQGAETAEQKHILEQQRWQVEARQKQAEEAKWAQEEETEKIQLVLAKIDASLKRFKQEKDALEKKKLQIQKFLSGLEFFQEKEKLTNKAQLALKQKPGLESQYQLFLNQQKTAEIELLAVQKEEQQTETEERNLEKQIQQALDSRERRRIEQERWQIAEKRRMQEKRRWEKEKAKETLSRKLKDAESQLRQCRQTEEILKRKTQEIETQISSMPLLPELAKFWETKPGEQQSPSEPKAVPQAPPAVPAFHPAPVPPVPPVPQVPQAPPAPMPSVVSAVKNEELAEEQRITEQIRLQAKAKEHETVGKAIQEQIKEQKQAITAEKRQKQEEEERQKSIQAIKKLAEQEQRRAFFGKLKGPMIKAEVLRQLSKISAKEEAQRKEFLERISEKTKPAIKPRQKKLEESVVFHPMIRKTSLLEKIAIRGLVVILIVGIGFGIYLGIAQIIKQRKGPAVSPGVPAVGGPTSTPDVGIEWPVVPGTISTSSATSSLPATTALPATTTLPSPSPVEALVSEPPVPLIPVSKTLTLLFLPQAGISIASTTQVFQSQIAKGAFEQIAVKNVLTNEFLGTFQTSQALQMGLPDELEGNDRTSTILLFGSKYGNRLGFVAQSASAGDLYSAFRSWENQAETNTELLFSFMGKTGPALNKTFTALRYGAVLMRCQTFTKQDLGICFSVFKNYFIFTSSFEQMARIVDKLP